VWPAPRPATPVFVPAELASTARIEARAAAQLAARESVGMFADFGLEDRQPASGIRFQRRFVDHAGKHYKAVHYDHRNGIAMAHVDGDGRLDVYFVPRAGRNVLYRNSGAGPFENITARVGDADEGAIGAAARFADIDNDGDGDLHVTNVTAPNRLYVNDGNGVSTDSSDGSGLKLVEHRSAAVFFDYDPDGLLDVFVCIVGEYTTDTSATVSPALDSEAAEHFSLGIATRSRVICTRPARARAVCSVTTLAIGSGM
jgi:hypothetical protein